LIIRLSEIIVFAFGIDTFHLCCWAYAKFQLGSRLLELLIEAAYVQPPLTQSGDSIPEFRPAFRHRFKTVTKYPGSKLVRRYGVIECDSLLLAGLDKSVS
jgi:hypothetical protein